MTTFIEAEDKECRAPIEGDAGPGMEICGARTKPGSSYCPECHARFYYRPSKRELSTMDFTAGKPLRPRR